MPQSQGKKRSFDKDSMGMVESEGGSSSGVAEASTALNSSGSSNGSVKSRKRKRCDISRFSDLESEFEDCDLEDAAALETKLRKVARKNSLTHDEMMKLLHKFVKNEHILALVTLKAEDELAKEKQENDQRAIIITETTSVPKLTRAKARELNKTPIIKLTPLKDKEPEPEIAALIKADLHSDEDDDEYEFKDEDFVSDDDPNNTISDLDSNPRTPQTPISQIENSPIKLSDDGCFKVPFSKKQQELSEELRIAARTRSKLCLEQTTIEDLQSEFIPPDVEEQLESSDLQPMDEDWMQFLNDFTKPLNNSLVADDDDPINDPEYVAAEKEPDETKWEAILAALTYPPVKTRYLPGLRNSIACNFQVKSFLLKYGKNYHADDDSNFDTVVSKQECSMISAAPPDFFNFRDGAQNIDAEELRDVNISKKELSELVAELYDGLMTDGLCMDSIDLETPRKFWLSCQDDKTNIANTSGSNLDVSQQLEYNKTQSVTLSASINTEANQISTEFNQLSSADNQNEYTFQPGVMSTPTSHNKQADNYNTNNEYSNLNPNTEALIPIAQLDNNIYNSHNTVVIPSTTINTQLELIAVPIPGEPNCFQLAKVVDNLNNLGNSSFALPTTNNSDICKNDLSSKSLRNCNNYVTLKRDIIAEYIDKFKSLQRSQDNKFNRTAAEIKAAGMLPNMNAGFTQYQYDLMQQQLRIHVQQLMQTFVQTYCHPELWKTAPKSKELLLDLEEKAKHNVNFQVWNLKPAIELMYNWQNELDEDTPENTELMNFLYHESDVTHHDYRRIPRFHPRILECYLNSPVFMYPKYLPKLPFTGKPSLAIFSPVESYLIAMGLEKHLQIIYEKKEKISKSTPLRVACKRLAKDTVCGKGYRRIWDHILHLQKVDYYNPIKYFFEHNRAPPVDHDPIWTFKNNIILAPKDRIPELPLAFQTYLQKKNEPPKAKPIKKGRKRSSSEVSDVYKNSYLEFVQEVVQDLHTPNLFYDPVVSSNNPLPNTDSNNLSAEKRPKLISSKTVPKKKLPRPLTINVNYVYGNGLDISTTATNASLGELTRSSINIGYSTPTLSQNITTSSNKDSSFKSLLVADSTINNNSTDTTINSNIDLTQNNLTNITDCPVITYNFDWKTKTLQPSYNVTQEKSNPSTCSVLPTTNFALSCHPITNKKRKIKTHKKVYTTKLHKRIKQKANAYREKLYLKARCEELITAYSLYLNTILLKHKSFSLIQYYYRYFKALELYTCLLKGLKAICKTEANTMSNTSNNSPNMKRTRHTNSNTEDDNSPPSARQVRKLNRQEENLRHMVLPDTPEETNRKDAIYAFNFYEKVEESFKLANKPDECKKFNAILKSFDPKKDKVSELYYKLEKLFLPDHPELAQVFLTFLLPSEAAEIGKFFEYFMINNMTTFINKLNIYFNKQPAQIRKVYNCLNDLAEDPEVTMKKVETKIVPLLKGNQFLIDWFMQQFPQNTPPERLFSTPEQIYLKDQQSNRAGEYIETLSDLTDSPANDGRQQQSCQLKYINGRIFYGSKMLLPAKLSFMAASFKHKVQINISPASSSATACVHGIREYGEKRLQAAVDLNSTHPNAIETPFSDEQDKSEEEDVSKTLVIDTTVDEEDSSSSIELCDEASLKAHATRLNPSVYSSSCYSANTTSTPNLINNFHSHHANAKRVALNFNDEAKLSPRKSCTSSNSAHLHLPSPIPTSFSCPQGIKEKRKSPSKKTKSPLSNKHFKNNNVAVQPMVVIHESNSAIQCAKRLKCLIDEEGQQNDSVNEVIDSKEILKIVAKSKSFLRSPEVSAPAQICENVKEEKAEYLEFLTEQSALSSSPFPCLRIETDSNEEDAYNTKTSQARTQQMAPPKDDRCKLEGVTLLTTDTEEKKQTFASNDVQSQVVLNTAWTRDEDKTILIEMKTGSQNRTELFQRIAEKLNKRTIFEITSRHQFLMDFLSKLQGK